MSDDDDKLGAEFLDKLSAQSLSRELRLPFLLMIETSNQSEYPFDIDSVLTPVGFAIEELRFTQPVSFMFCDLKQMRELNLKYRGVNEATDVLTFPSGSKAPLPIGDIAVCIPFAAEQAKLRGVTLENEVIALAIHGLLHLYGYDDIEEEDRNAMQQAMNEIGQKIGVQIDGAWTSILH